MTDRLMIFAKAPEPGCVKTRLQLPPEEAAELHAAFVADVVDRHQAKDRVVTVWRAGDLEHGLWETLPAHLAEQPEGDLGDRMAHAFATELALGSAVVVLGTDSPTLPPRLVAEAFERLKSSSVVVGPACDGGYYLLGLRGDIPLALFAEGIAWGGGDVLSTTLERLQSAAVDYDLLDFWYDVDRPADLRLLCAHVPTLRDQGEPIPVRTLEVLTRRGHG